MKAAAAEVTAAAAVVAVAAIDTTTPSARPALVMSDMMLWLTTALVMPVLMIAMLMVRTTLVPLPERVSAGIVSRVSIGVINRVRSTIHALIRRSTPITREEGYQGNEDAANERYGENAPNVHEGLLFRLEGMIVPIDCSERRLFTSYSGRRFRDLIHQMSRHLLTEIGKHEHNMLHSVTENLTLKQNFMKRDLYERTDTTARYDCLNAAALAGERYSRADAHGR
jgi:hypothetical protein